MKEDIINIIREILYVKDGEITKDTILDEIIKDSMQVIELIAVLGNKYKLLVNPKEMDNIKTVGDLIIYINRRKGTHKGGKTLDSY